MDHKILVDKLFKYGIRGNIFNWFKSNRKQYVNWQGSYSEIETVSCGVPQGSILGPLLFILYVNDILRVSNKFTSIIFADDATILFEGYNIHSIVTSLNHELGKLMIWLNANELSINVSKTHYMVFHRARQNVDHKDINLNNYIVQVHLPFFIIIIDDKLKWGNHISYIKNKIANGNTRTSNKFRPALARHAYRDKDFRFISVHVRNYIWDIFVNINVSFPSFKNLSNVSYCLRNLAMNYNAFAKF